MIVPTIEDVAFDGPWNELVDKLDTTVEGVTVIVWVVLNTGDVKDTLSEADVAVKFKDIDETGEGDGVAKSELNETSKLDESVGDGVGISEEADVISLKENSGCNPDPDPEKKSEVGDKLGVGIAITEVATVCETEVGVTKRELNGNDVNGVENLEMVDSTLCSLKLTVADGDTVVLLRISMEVVFNIDGD